MEFIKVKKLDNGQSTVEYILLLAVVVSLVITILNSDIVKSYIGKDSQVMANMRKNLEYSYRHGLGRAGSTEEDNFDYSGNHNTYYNNQVGKTHFFGLKEEYP